MRKSKSASAQIVSPVVRCRKGDIAILLVGRHAGYIVDVLEFQAQVETERHGTKVNVWHIHNSSFDPNYRHCIDDKYLLPIRPGDLEETETDELGLKEGARHE